MTSTIHRDIKTSKSFSKQLILIIALVLTTFIAEAQDGHTITVTVNNVQNTKGKVVFALHTEDTFMKAKAIKNAEGTIEGNSATVTFNTVSPGEYAILVLHDENDNGRMDYMENGMPLESFGASNNVMSFGPPQYDDAKFSVTDKDIELTIRF